MKGQLHSYPSIYNLGHAAIAELFFDDVLAEEKIDGSQLSFGMRNGELCIRSKGQEILADAPEKMFAKGVEYIKSIAHLLKDSWTYRGEYLQKPHHNVLSYDRIPQNHIIIFDIDTVEENYLHYLIKQREAENIGLEWVRMLFYGKVDNPEQLKELLEHSSTLGSTKIEGIVIKNYNRFGKDHKVLMGKYVSEKFKEVKGVEWSKSNPHTGDVIQDLIIRYKTDPRWNKAIQHLREQGILTDSPQDIGNLLKEIKTDITKECADEIKERLFNYAIDKILRGCCAGFTEWYKEQLMKKQFEIKQEELPMN